jgi:hypothetical protein
MILNISNFEFIFYINNNEKYHYNRNYENQDNYDNDNNKRKDNERHVEYYEKRY